MDYTNILYEKRGSTGIITLNRPQSMNALNSVVFGELKHLLAQIEGDNEVRALILTGSVKYFAAGADIQEIGEITSPVDAHEYFREARAVFSQIEDLEKPVIAAVSGFALGGGCELALACDIRLAAENALFGLPEIKIGLMPGGGGTQRLPRIVGVGVAKELLFTGDFIDAREAHRIGLVNKVFPLDSFSDDVAKMVSRIVDQPAIALKSAKLSVNGGINMDIKSAVAYEARCFELLFSTADQKEGAKAFIEKRKPLFSNK